MTQTPKTHDSDCACDECASGKRNRFFRGKSMRAEEFQIEQAYGIGRRRLLNRSVVGWGIVYGLSVRQDDPPEPKKFRVGRGLALDRHGREIALSAPAYLNAKNTFISEPGAGCDFKGIDQIANNRDYLLKIHYAERRFGDVASLDDCGGCDEPEKKYVCETAVFSLTLLEGRCPCEERKCHRRCTCPHHHHHDDVDHDGHGKDDKEQTGQRAEALRSADQHKADTHEPYDREPHEHDSEHEPDDHEHDHRHCGCRGRGPHDCLCEWITTTAGPDTHCTLCQWNGYSIDPKDGVALACVRVWTTDDKCDPVAIRVTEACDPRRLIKNNDLLYDLIRGCDLTHISSISWAAWHRSGDLVDWLKFSSWFTPEPPDPGKPRLVKTRFVVQFSGPVLRKTILRDTVVMTAITIEQASGWRIPRRVPIARIDTTPTHPMPDGLTDQMQLYVDYAWYRDELEKEAQSWLSRTGFVMEIEIRGDLILDCHRQAVDANAVGLIPAPTGNGTPGGTYLSSFWVKPKPGTYWNDSENA
jgi:hypothetical protein